MMEHMDPCNIVQITKTTTYKFQGINQNAIKWKKHAMHTSDCVIRLVMTLG